MVTGVVMAFFMPGLYDDPSPWLLPRLRYFSERELYILKWRVIIDSPSKGKKSSHISFAQLKSAVSPEALASEAWSELKWPSAV